jgi:excisionase family DNA binding protein
MNADELLTAEEVAEILGVTVKTVYQYRIRDTGPLSWRAGKRLVFPRSGVDAYLARKRQGSLRGAGV